MQRRQGALAQQRLLTVALLVLCAWPTLAALRPGQEVEPFIGWKGETFHPDGEAATPSDKRPWVQVLSWKPRAFVYHHFLSDAEAAHIIKLAAPQMKRSTVVGAHNQGVVDSIRTSAGTFLMRNQDEVIKAVQNRLAVWTGLPPSHQEDLQVLRYGPTNKYGAHIDGLGRLCTVLIYLVAPEEGGETAFAQTDESHWVDPQMGEASQGNFSQCAKGHVAYKPKRGDALLFWDRHPDGKTEDPFSMHTGCPVLGGEHSRKWNAVSWLHPVPFREDEWNRSLTTPHTPQPDPGLCTNRHNMCKTWAESGECKKNPGYMLGGSSGQGMCRLACGECEPCDESDKQCIRKNRERGGYLNIDEEELKLAELGVEKGALNF